MSISFLEKDELFPVALSKLKPVDVLLDIGCGIMPQHYVRPRVHICCEPFQQYVEHLQKKIESDKSGKQYVILKATWGEAMQLIPDKSVDSIFLIDVVEHLEKQEALDLIAQSIRKIRRQMVIFTPLGFLPQHHPDGKDAWGLDGGAWQEHKSGWQPEDFDATWDLYIAKVFHTTNNVGKPFETPYGALWAIKTLPDAEPEKPAGVGAARRKSKRQVVHNMVDKAIDLVSKIKP